LASYEADIDLARHHRCQRGRSIPSIRVILTGNDIPGVATQTVRVIAANINWLKEKPDVAKRFVSALKKTIDWAYSTDEAVAMWAEMHKMTVDEARKARDAAYPKAMLDPSKIGGLDMTMKQAVETKRLPKPLTPEQQAEFVSWLPKLGS
jgi:ABC-type nitrate/sulfonate/bicarbonate transport system substrate-binding protein